MIESTHCDANPETCPMNFGSTACRICGGMMMYYSLVWASLIIDHGAEMVRK